MTNAVQPPVAASTGSSPLPQKPGWDWKSRRGAALLFAMLFIVIPVRGQCSSLCSSDFSLVSHLSRGSFRPRVVVDTETTQTHMIWVDIAASGIYSRAAAARPWFLRELIAGEEVHSVPAFLDDMAQKGYLAIRVPHAPPSYTPSQLIPGISSHAPNAVEFRYFAPPDAPSATIVPVPVTRMTEYEAIVNAKYPITDGRSHWEVWGLTDKRLPIPEGPFRLKEEWPQAVEIMFRIDYGSGADPLAALGSQVGIVLYTGQGFLGPYETVLSVDWAAPNQPRVTFNRGHCDFFSLVEPITPTVAFSHIHWLGNWENVARTYTITATSSQGWAYTYFYGERGQPLQQAPGLPFAITVQPRSGNNLRCMQIEARYTPTFAVSDSVMETFHISATCTTDPTAWAEAYSFAVGPGYQPRKDSFILYLPLILR